METHVSTATRLFKKSTSPRKEVRKGKELGDCNKSLFSSVSNTGHKVCIL